MDKRLLMPAVACAIVICVSACSSESTVPICAGVGLIRVVPTDTTIAVGGSFNALSQEGESCGGPLTEANFNGPRVNPGHWSTGDTLIITVDSASGRVTGRGKGDAHVADGKGGNGVVHVR